MYFKAETSKEAQGARGVRLTLSPSQKLLSRRDFLNVFRYGRRFFGSGLLVYYRLGTSPAPKLGITVSKRWGKACKRNRFKRIVREAYRQIYPKLPDYLRLNVHPRLPFEALSVQEAKRSLEYLVKKIAMTS